MKMDYSAIEAFERHWESQQCGHFRIKHADKHDMFSVFCFAGWIDAEHHLSSQCTGQQEGTEPIPVWKCPKCDFTYSKFEAADSCCQ